ncbi:MAG: hypothetical protein A3C79_01565 [Candidatus Taylorbacteria bacterium RIFCSPHIGHO2_02_FULL_45_28]|uniref:Uncharacterized protein n=1 Tax=Candidatus Taylorbacteria bacterium RIFCSPHIGHO2_12_FULL_45_16 TaxID=1802315 RepID=A0A1G2MYU3_9BACT|nr:MAG: hypothetical protein A2830_03730 [Candidatus Taylorbacteria bacterium RIFCSPHIGHO2_01_FULL_44_110]OHA25124.1 MAG: hypothetical protein A3C79_01565 [Candidatus Taylorbacteria bacterium RIFCSPHIGHO2_02_FULL_45_28]OHA29004.1 MAG: hypothetical protein A3F51_01945 [Candidatus Taylorbacteria bacterium RIFCSPHIGHO2_12_FULL_45_16]OHA33122.1 MAG: hypothetical protein A3A23_03625 [Candidatus Taylorbacteria bacterium RIFCSPLOWO2_01_FULL_45_59]OHA39390.1 MAG: hypothetical protein A3I98_02305 [Candi
MKNKKLRFCVAVAGGLLLVGLKVPPRQEAVEPTSESQNQSENGWGVVPETTNAQDVTEEALNALGFSLSNTVTVSVK